MTLAQTMYESYNAGGDPATANKNYRGEPCPEWADLPENIRAKWGAAAEGAIAFCATPDGDFAWAIHKLQQGARVRRAGWNGKGMWLALTPGSTIAATEARSVATLALAAERSPYLTDAGSLTLGAHIDMRAADGSLVIGWLASQTDMLATDWELAE